MVATSPILSRFYPDSCAVPLHWPCTNSSPRVHHFLSPSYAQLVHRKRACNRVVCALSCGLDSERPYI